MYRVKYCNHNIIISYNIIIIALERSYLLLGTAEMFITIHVRSLACLSCVLKPAMFTVSIYIQQSGPGL